MTRLAWLRCTLRCAALFACVPALAAAGIAQNGAMLYATHCSSCHGAAAQGTSVAPPLLGKSAVDVHFMLDTGRMPASVPGVNSIHRQPAFDEQQIDAIVAYVDALSHRAHLHPDTSLPVLGPGNVARGARLFAENCAQCHGAAGDGASVGESNVAPSLMNATVFEVAEAIRTGPGIMPRFGPSTLSDRDVSDIARFVNYLQTSEPGPDLDAGGISLAHVGPVAEGIVAWIFGLGLLVLFVRLIGTTK